MPAVGVLIAAIQAGTGRGAQALHTFAASIIGFIGWVILLTILGNV